MKEFETDNTNIRSSLLVPNVCIVPIEGNKDELEDYYGPEKTDLSVLPEAFLDALKQLDTEINVVISHVNERKEKINKPDISAWAKVFVIYSDRPFTYVLSRLIDKSWFSENGKQNAIYRTCFRVGQAFGYHISGDCAVKLIDTISDDNNHTQFKFYITK